MDKSLVSHIGIAVADLEKAVGNFRLLNGGGEPDVVEVPDQKVRVAIFSAGNASGGGRIELVAPTGPDSPVAKFIEKRGEGLHHICIYVDDIGQTLARLKEAGIKLVDQVPRIGAEGSKIAFVHPSGMNGVLIELEEKTK